MVTTVMSTSFFLLIWRDLRFGVLLASLLGSGCAPTSIEFVVGVVDAPVGTDKIELLPWGSGLDVDSQQVQVVANRQRFTVSVRLHVLSVFQPATLESGTIPLHIAVAAFDGSGCLLASGSSEVGDATSPIEVRLKKVEQRSRKDKSCSQQRPLAVSVEPADVLAETPPELLISGWGFTAQNQVFFGAHRQRITSVSPLSIKVERPELPLQPGPVSVRVFGSDGTISSSRDDIFSVAFSDLHLNSIEFGATQVDFLDTVVADLDEDGMGELVSIRNNPDGNEKIRLEIWKLSNPNDGQFRKLSTFLLDAVDLEELPISISTPRILMSSESSMLGRTLLVFAKPKIVVCRHLRTSKPMKCGTLLTSSEVRDVAIGNFAGSTNDEIVLVGNDGKPRLLQFDGNSGYSFRETELNFNVGRLTASSVASSDLNQDGKLDLVFAEVGSPYSHVSIAFRSTDGTYRLERHLVYDSNNGDCYRGIAIGDLNGDGFLDIAVNGINQSIESSGRPDGPWIVRTLPSAASNCFKSLAIIDMNRDHIEDLVWMQEGVLVGLLSPGKQQQIGYKKFERLWERDRMRYMPQRLEKADIDGDGIIDLVFGSFAVIIK